ncbi:MAG TPA: Glu/Leu/Phe/Val dehydrogenase dimerization domain-containing protein [Solirubrobacterales bacterium]|nr:Glu/Leu/Phe/Val dehydrogenase dimerization domain-containing protein [Solirubrobacterales bacterium]
MSPRDFETVELTRGARSGATMAIAVHSTRLGPALGGARLWRYPGEDAVRLDAMRLAMAMTSKAAAAGLALGGGKGAIAWPGEEPPRGEERRAVLLDFADAVEGLGGRYVTAEDVGTCAADMVMIRERTSHVVGLPEELGGTGDPSPATARGVLAAIAASLEQRFDDPSTVGRRVCLIGAGHVGTHLAHMLAEAGADLVISDVDPTRRDLATELDAGWTDPEAAPFEPCDVLAPCALGGVVDSPTATRLRCAIVCGAANNVLTGDAAADVLQARGILYAPDFIANAGGLISVYAELRGLDREEVLALADGIGGTLRDVYATSTEEQITPLAAAQRIAAGRLALAPASAAA